jgi:hypothetical protein
MDQVKDRAETKPHRSKKSKIALSIVVIMDIIVLFIFFITKGGAFDVHATLSPIAWQFNISMDYVVLATLLLTIYLTVRQYLKWKYRHALYIMLSWLFLTISGVSRIIEKALTFQIRLTFAWYIPIAFALLFMLDSISRESIEPIKIIIASVLSVLFITNLSLLFIILLIMFLISVATYYILIIYMSAPSSLKRSARLALLGVLIFGYGNMLVSNLMLELVIPGITSLSSAIGYFLYAISFIQEPKLAYILPFRVISLTVFETTGGIPLFSHVWKKSEEHVDDEMFSGMLQGIGLVLDEAINAGDLEEIKTSRAVLLIKRSKTSSIASVLVTSRFSRTLQLALYSFANKFFAQYEQFISTPIIASKFDSASALIDECFAFIPQYD